MYDLLYDFVFLAFGNYLLLSINYAWNVLFAILSLLISTAM